MRKDAQKGYARLAQTAERQTTTTTTAGAARAHIHLKLCKFYYANCCVRCRPLSPSTPSALRPSSLQQEACLTLAVERRTKKDLTPRVRMQ